MSEKEVDEKKVVVEEEKEEGELSEKDLKKVSGGENTPNYEGKVQGPII